MWLYIRTLQICDFFTFCDPRPIFFLIFLTKMYDNSHNFKATSISYPPFETTLNCLQKVCPWTFRASNGFRAISTNKAKIVKSGLPPIFDPAYAEWSTTRIYEKKFLVLRDSFGVDIAKKICGQSKKGVCKRNWTISAVLTIKTYINH